ncbi:CNDP dipeptidase [Trametes polyzona]|nr:CNDP dipeptidase [Trametes polyzona]
MRMPEWLITWPGKCVGCWYVYEETQVIKPHMSTTTQSDHARVGNGVNKPGQYAAPAVGVPDEFLKFIDDNAQSFVDRLADAVAIKSVSGDSTLRDEVCRMGDWLEGELKRIGVSTKLIDLGPQLAAEGDESLHLPPLVLGRIGEDANKKTILIYGHYDVQPAEMSDGWNTDPWVLDDNKTTGRLTGRGATDDKGPVLGWLNVLEAHQTLGIELPVNLRLLFEGMEESGSQGLDGFIIAEAKKGEDGYFNGVNCVCISDNYWLNARTPCLTYGVRGLVYFSMNVTGADRDLHSGMFGRVVHEPMTDLSILMSKLVAPNGTILIDGIEDMVPPPDEEERKIYEAMDYTVQDLDAMTGASVGLSDDKVDRLMGRMRYPALSIHGVQGSFDTEGTKTVIPHSVTAKFSIRIVNPQMRDKVTHVVKKYVCDQFDAIGTKNKMCIDRLDGADAWVTDYKHWNYEAAAKATQMIYGRPPDLTREGGSIPVTLTFENNLGVNVLLLPMGRGDDGAHSANEKIDRSNFIEGSKLFGVYLYEVAAAATD